MQFTLVHSSITSIQNVPSDGILLTPALTGKYIVIFCDSLGKNPTWRRAGTLISQWDDSNIGRVTDAYWACGLGFRRITLDEWQFLNPFVFRPKPWLVNIQLKLWSTPDFDIYDQVSRIEKDIQEIRDLIN